MRKASPRVLFTFYTTEGAITAEKVCKEKQLSGRLVSAPRGLAEGCCIAWSAPLEERSALERAIGEAQIEVAGIYEWVLRCVSQSF